MQSSYQKLPLCAQHSIEAYMSEAVTSQFGRAVLAPICILHYTVFHRVPRLAVELGSRVDGEAYGWAWKPYGWFDPAPRPRDIAHTHFYR